VFRGVWLTDCRDRPGILSPPKAAFSCEKSTYYWSYYYSSSSFYFLWYSYPDKNSSNSTSPPKKSGRMEGSANSYKFYSSSPTISIFSWVWGWMDGSSLFQIVSKSMGVLTKTRLHKAWRTDRGHLGNKFVDCGWSLQADRSLSLKPTAWFCHLGLWSR